MEIKIANTQIINPARDKKEKKNFYDKMNNFSLWKQ